MKQQMKLALLGGALLGLVACGGGGGGSGSSSGAVSNDISAEMAERIKREKVIIAVVDLEALDEPTFNTKFILKGRDFGAEKVDLDLFPRYQLVVQENWTEEYDTKKGHYADKGFWRVYNQLYSAVVGDADTEVIENPMKASIGPLNFYDNYDTLYVVGVNTPEKQLPSSGLSTYKGVAFDANESGVLHYQVDFAKKEGSGTITGLEKFGTITLETGKIGNLSLNSQKADSYFKENQVGITGGATAEKIADVTSDKTTTRDVVKGYDLQFFGPNAEEITGIVKTSKQSGYGEYFGPEAHDQGRISFAGTKQ